MAEHTHDNLITHIRQHVYVIEVGEYDDRHVDSAWKFKCCADFRKNHLDQEKATWIFPEDVDIDSRKRHSHHTYLESCCPIKKCEPIADYASISEFELEEY